VLDCLNGYLLLVDSILDGGATGEWNFGPTASQSKSVSDVADIAGRIWGVEKKWVFEEGTHPYEAELLVLNSEKARAELGWSDKLNFEESVEWTINWYKNVQNGESALAETLKNIRDFEAR
jgi:CDP-glucose 4,6-dehydratase